MYVIIMGGGRVGRALAELLIDNGIDITLIESDLALCDEITEELDALVVNGNGTNSKLLEELDIDEAEFFIATTGSDEANLLSCILVKKYNVKHIIARVSNPEHEEAFKEVGIEHVISPESAAAAQLQKLVTRPNAAEIMTLGEGDAEIWDMTITNDKVVGKPFKEITPGKEYIIISTYDSNGKLEIPQPDTIITKGEKVTVLVKRGHKKKVSKKLEK